MFSLLIIPCTIMSAIGAYIFYAQHNFPDMILKDDHEWSYPEAALISSSFIKMNRILQWFTANIGYHHPSCKLLDTFYRLPEVMEAS